MRLLICTQAVDEQDPILGFFVAWVARFANDCERVTVVCLRKGNYTLPKNVDVISLGERSKIVRAFEVCTIAWGRRGEYDAVFVHMNPEYVVAAGWLWRLLKKKVGLWYVHKSRTTLLEIALRFVAVVFTVTGDTFPIPSSKVQITGHGIDTDLFSGISAVDNFWRVVTIGRISAKKNTQKIIDATLCFAESHENVRLDVYGEAVTREEKEYAAVLLARLPSSDPRKIVTLKGAITHAEVPSALSGASVVVNMSETGGVDKAVLEALAMTVPVISTSRAHEGVLHRYPQLMADDADDVVRALEYVYTLPHTVRIAMGGDLREEVIAHHSLSPLITRIVWTLSESR